MVACVHVIGEEELLWYFHSDLLRNHDFGSSVLPVTVPAFVRACAMRDDGPLVRLFYPLNYGNNDLERNKRIERR
jgi:hypothetical protein